METHSSRVLAIIPARGGSKGIPRKNLAELGGVPLIAWSIRVALETPSIDRVVVSTEDPEIAEIARSWGAEVPFLRPTDLAGDTSSVADAVGYTTKRIKEGGESWGILAVLFPTQPFRTPALLEQAIELCRTSAYEVRAVVPYYFNPGLWLAQKNGRWQHVYSEQAGEGYRCSGLVFACVEEQRPPAVTSPYDRLAFDANLLAQGDLRPFRPKAFLQVPDPVMALDIDYPLDLEHAREAVRKKRVPWHPVDGLNTSVPSRTHADAHPSFSWSCLASVRIFEDAAPQEDSSVSVRLDRILSPAGMRRLVDLTTPHSGKAVEICKEGIGACVRGVKDAPSLVLERSRLPVGWGKIFSRFGFANFFIRGKGRYLLGTSHGTLAVHVDDARVGVSLPDTLRYGDEMWLSLYSDHDIDVLILGRYLWTSGGWRYRGAKFSALGVLPPQCRSETGRVVWQMPSNVNRGWVQLVREGFSPGRDAEIWDYVEVEGLIRYPYREWKWVNELTGDKIIGRQFLPEIHEWAGWLYLPADVNIDAEWQVEYK